ncbi:MAG: FtsW/RodA/SpoVE family cell cycle protein [Campylobacteraceae bacterium]|jgi:cell division protein FtsW|nr:FtsW/RodA/SpoVE family cell cycle protein [Campylobacteraceae bacterium]
MPTDKTLFILCSFCVFVGMIASFSLSAYAILRYDISQPYHFFVRQCVAGFLGIFAMWTISRLNPEKHLVIIGFSIFFACLFAMGFMHYLPEHLVTSAGGAKRWIRLPGFSFAPVEFFKIGFVFFLAWSFARKINHEKKPLLQEILLLLPYFVMFAIFVIYLIAVMQNDIGQVIVLALTFSVMAFFAGTSFRFFSLAILLSTIVATFAVINSENRIMRVKIWWSTAQNAILSFLPDKVANALRVENTPEPYQLSHSLNAIKHGGFFGEGIGDGIVKLGYLSDVHTDFVLAGITEEAGAIGSIGITAVFCIIIYRIFKIASRSQNRVYSLFALGISMLIVFSFLMNAYGVTSITPIKGIAVPFLSYGGSSLLATCIGVGMVLMISKRADLK